MTGILSGNIKRLMVCLLILIGLSSSSMAFQDKITANQNIYKRVTGGAVQGTDFVIVNQLDSVSFPADKVFKPGEIVLVIQMKGVQIDVPETGSYGTPHDVIGTPGQYEFLKISSIDIPTRKIIFTRNLLNNYKIKGDVQLIWVPSYPSVDINANITCQAWDSISKTGGVLTMVVGKTLRLFADIDVSGKGFAGGAPVKGDGNCSESAPAYAKYAYDTSFHNSGLKGEGIATEAWVDALTQLPLYSLYAKGKGANFNSGGGGNGRFSGGGGGSNYGAGGHGGRENTDICTTPTDWGSGGKQIKSTSLVGGIYMGGGGGGATSGAGGTASTGGKGGGIIIILCNDIQGNGHSIKADGASPLTTPAGLAGAGGGGAGGSVILYIESSASNLNITSNGGKGGNANATNIYGEGGGGGGGLIWINPEATFNTVSRTAALGTAGTRPAGGGGLATGGAVGEILYTYVPKLNGFLFNFIYSAGTLSPVDSTCSNQIPFTVIGTKPVGVSASYTYTWERKNDFGGAWTVIAGSDIQNYAFGAVESDTLFIRRRIKDNITTIEDISKEAKIIVQPKILNNNIRIRGEVVSLTDTICSGKDPRLIDSIAPLIFVPTLKYMFYEWQDSTVASAAWSTVTGATDYKYDPPPPLTVTTWYRRIVTSGRCIDKSAGVRVTVLTTLSANNITAAQEVCHEGTFVDLSGSVSPVLTGGDVTDYRYKWETSLSNAPGSWSGASGTITGPGYNPPESGTDTEVKKYYRRLVFSGNNNACIDSSSSVLLTEWKKISNNIITSADQTICSGTTPNDILANAPADGNHSYTILWQENTGSGWSTATGPNPVTQDNFKPKPLNLTTWYRRYVTSSFCKDSINVDTVYVHQPITNSNIRLWSGVWDTTICSVSKPQPIEGLIPGITSGTGNPANNIYQWMGSATKVGGYGPIAGATSKNYQPDTLKNITSPTLPQYFYYRRLVSNGMCSATSDSAVTFKVLPKISANNITSDKTAVCSGLAPVLTGTVLTGGAGGTPTWVWEENNGGPWTAVGSSQNYNPAPLFVPTQFRRTIYSGPANTCKDISAPLSIGINPLPAGTITPATDNTCEGTPKPLNINITGSVTGPWKVSYNDGYSNTTPADYSSAGITISLTPGTNGNTTRSYNYTLFSIKDGNGCDAPAASLTGSRQLLVYKKPVADAGSSAASTCGTSYNLVAVPSVPGGTWTFPAGVTNTTPIGSSVTVAINPATAPPQITYRLYWEELNPDITCSDKDSIDITFYKTVARPNLGPDKDPVYLFDNIDSLHATKPPFGTGVWKALSGGTVDSPSDTLTKVSGLYGSAAGVSYQFTWTVTNVIASCFEDDTITYRVFDLIVPKGFSPNNDPNNYNEVFKIRGLDTVYSEITLRIMNGSGAEVFYATNTGGNAWAEWDGKNEKGEDYPEGTYYYLLTIKSTRNDKVFKKSGFVLLKRYNSQ
jgi:hypothetical protein